jgi:hypothetical protein
LFDATWKDSKEHFLLPILIGTVEKLRTSNGCDRAGAKDFGGNRPIFGPRGPSVQKPTVRKA